MSSALEAPTVCPTCGTAIPVDPGYSAWCDSCGWNVDPYPPAAASSRREKRRAALAAAVDRAFESYVRDPATSGGSERMWLMALAICIHVATVALVGAAVWILLDTAIAIFIRGAAAVVLFGVAIQVAPRLRGLPAKSVLATRSAAPGLWRLIDQVSATGGLPLPHTVVVTGAFHTDLARVGWRRQRVLSLGMAEWMTIDPAERVAAVGLALAEGKGRGRPNPAIADAAADSVHRWLVLFQPVRGDRATRGLNVPSAAAVVGGPADETRWTWGTGRMMQLADFTDYQATSAARRGAWNVLTKPLRFTADAVGVRLATAAAVRAAVRQVDADAVGATVGSTAAIVALLRHSYLSDVVASWRGRRMATSRAVDWADLRATLDAVPPRQVDRLSRVGALRRARVDNGTPSTAARIEALLSRPAQAGSVWLSDADDSAITGELSALAIR